MSMMSHAITLPRVGPDAHSAGLFARFIVIALTAFLTVVDLFATQAILPSLTRAYDVSPAAMGQQSMPARSEWQSQDFASRS